MELDLNHDLLIDALKKWRMEQGRGGLSELHEKTGVHNLGRIASGKVTAHLDTWMQLHLSVPQWIPPPTTITGARMVFVGGDAPLPDYVLNASRSRHQIEGEAAFFEMYAHYRSTAVINKLLDLMTQICDGIKKSEVIL